MGRSCNVDAIGLHNFKMENDSVVFCLNTNKKDQKGEAFIDSTYARAMAGVRRKYPEFDEDKNWRIGTCSKAIKDSNKRRKRAANAALV